MIPQDPIPASQEGPQARDTTWSDMNERLKALQDKYASLRDPEPRAFATRFRD